MNPKVRAAGLCKSKWRVVLDIGEERKTACHHRAKIQCEFSKTRRWRLPHHRRLPTLQEAKRSVLETISNHAASRSETSAVELHGPQAVKRYTAEPQDLVQRLEHRFAGKSLRGARGAGPNAAHPLLVNQLLDRSTQKHDTSRKRLVFGYR